MKNLIALFTLSTLLLFASCTKEELIQPQDAALTDIEMVGKIEGDSKSKIPSATIANARGNGIDVSVVSEAASSAVLNISFTSSHNFIDAVLAGTQTVDFTDGSGKTVSLTFGVNSYTGGNGTLDISLAIGGNDLTGLGMKGAQIIIVDETII